MSLLDEPEAQDLLADAQVDPDALRGCRGRLTRFLERYLPLFYRREQRGHAAAFVRGLLSGLERKSVEPIAGAAGIPRKTSSTSSAAAPGMTSASWPSCGGTSSRSSPTATA